MDYSTLEKNLIKLCKRKNVTKTVAFRDSGVGVKFLDNIKSGSAPSVEKVQKLSQYFGISTSELLGEQPIFTENELTEEEQEILSAWRKADKRAKDMVKTALEPFGLSASSDKAM